MTDGVDDQDIIGLVKAQHGEIRSLFAQITAPATSAERAQVFQCLVRLLAVNETAEEEIVHPEVRRVVGGDDIVERGIEEEAAAKRMLADLERLGVDDPTFGPQLASFRAAVEAHARSEEEEELPLLESHHDGDVRRRMATEFKLAERMAPTHPHPHGPDGMLGNLTVGPIVAVVDRVRDLIRGGRPSSVPHQRTNDRNG